MDRALLPIRNFIAIPIKQEIKEKITEFVLPLKKDNSNVKWDKKSNYHITLLFIGNSTGKEIIFIDKVLSEMVKEISNMHLEIKGIGAFPNINRAKTIWVGVKSDNTLLQFQNNLVKNIKKEIVIKNNNRFIPHITIGRVKTIANTELVHSLQKDKERFFGEQNIDNIVHYESKLTPKGAVYTVIKNYIIK